MKSNMNKLVLGMILLAGLAGFLIGEGCAKKEFTRIIQKDTITNVVTKERPVYVKPDVKIKTILIPTIDTIKVSQIIPCDTAFIVQADSVITTTKDTINIAFAHYPKWTKKKSEFSVVFKPRPDSILVQTINVPYEVKSETVSIGWVISAFAIGLGVGLLGGAK